MNTGIFLKVGELSFHKPIIEYYSKLNLNYFDLKKMKDDRNKLDHTNIKCIKDKPKQIRFDIEKFSVMQNFEKDEIKRRYLMFWQISSDDDE